MTAIEYRDSDVRSNELETGLSSSGESTDKDFEIVVSKPLSSSKPSFSSKPSSSSSSIPFHAFSESCLLEPRHLKSIQKRFQFPGGVVIRLPRSNEKACSFAHGEFPIVLYWKGVIKDKFKLPLICPHRLYKCCLGPEPYAFVLKKIAQEEKKMATRYSKDKYACVKSLKNEPLSQLTPGSKKRKLDEGKDETPAPLSLFGTPASSTPPGQPSHS